MNATDDWEQTGVCEPEVVWIPGEKIFRAWYRGGWGDQSVGVATSPDGLTWTKFAGNPVYGGGGSGVTSRMDGGQPYVFRDTSAASSEEQFRLFATHSCCSHAQESRVNVATSPDGYSWTTRNSSIPLPPAGSLFGNRVAWREGAEDWKMLQEVMIDSVWAIHLYFS